MIIQFFTPKGSVVIDSDTVSRQKLTAMGMNRAKLDAIILDHNPLADIEKRLTKLETDISNLSVSGP